MKSQEITGKLNYRNYRKMASDCFLLYALIPELKILSCNGSPWRSETYHMQKADLRDWCSKCWHNPARGLCHVGTWEHARPQLHVDSFQPGHVKVSLKREGFMCCETTLCFQWWVLSGLIFMAAHQDTCCPHSANEKSSDMYYTDVSKDGEKSFGNTIKYSFC